MCWGVEGGTMYLPLIEAGVVKQSGSHDELAGVSKHECMLKCSYIRWHWPPRCVCSLQQKGRAHRDCAEDLRYWGVACDTS